jgi:hypothetical protein
MSLKQSGRVATAAQRVGPLCACLWLPLCSVCAGTGLGAQEPPLARARAPASSQPQGEAGAEAAAGKERSLNKESIALPRRAPCRRAAVSSPQHRQQQPRRLKSSFSAADQKATKNRAAGASTVRGRGVEPVHIRHIAALLVTAGGRKKKKHRSPPLPKQIWRTRRRR